MRQRVIKRPSTAGTSKALILVGLLLAACGEDAPPPPPRPTGGANAPGAKPASTKDSKNKLAVKPKIEARVTDPEKANIRHTFRDRDFIADQNNRDPFQSFVLAQPGLGGGQQDALKRDPTKRCLRSDQFIASNYSYTDLRLVGIIAEKTQRRVLMMDSGNLGHIIRKGDCVGREKALVKDIGAGYVTFQVEPDDMNQARQVEEHSVQLYPNQMPLTSQPRLTEEPRPGTTVVAPGQQPAPQPTNQPVVGPN
jgi:hypothetical protein